MTTIESLEPVEIAAGWLQLRPPGPGDADWVLRACQDPEIQRWTTVPDPYTEADAEAFVRSIAPDTWASGEGATFGIYEAVSGVGLGMIGITHRDRANQTAAVGFWVAPWARRRGVAVQATRTVARWAFGAAGAARLEWLAEVGNVASRAVALRAGFVEEGVLRGGLRARNGGRVDAWSAALLPVDLATGSWGSTD